MATQPPPETPVPSEPVFNPEPTPGEVSPVGPDVDIPDTITPAQPGFANPMAKAASSVVGQRAPGDTEDADATLATMTASSGGLAGTSR